MKEALTRGSDMAKAFVIGTMATLMMVPGRQVTGMALAASSRLVIPTRDSGTMT